MHPVSVFSVYKLHFRIQFLNMSRGMRPFLDIFQSSCINVTLGLLFDIIDTVKYKILHQFEAHENHHVL